MNFNIDSQVLETINAIWATPYGVAAKFLFYIGLALLVVVLNKRHNMSLWHALLALSGLKKVPNRDSVFNTLVAIVIVGCFGLMVVSMQVVTSAQ